MPIQQSRDDGKRRLVLVASGSFDPPEIIALFRRMVVDGTWSYGVLYDMRFITGVPKVADLKVLADAAAEVDTTDAPRGPLAIVATDPTVYGMACAYASLVRWRRIEVFRDRAEAEEWLSAVTP